MKLLDLLVQELESWPEGKVYAYQSVTSRIAIFSSSPMDDNRKTIILSQIAPNRGPDHKVTREEWETAKIKSLPFFHTVANILGEERAVKELLAVRKHGTYICSDAEELTEAFVFVSSPQGYDFWTDIAEPNRKGKKLKDALDLITSALNPEHRHYIRLQEDGSGSVRDQDDNEIIYFHNTESLVKKYLAPTPKFDHWHLLHERFQWIAKDQSGIWWAYDVRPILEDDY